MAGDYSRRTFDGSKDFSLVRMQQGRLFSDADWNEQGDILRASDRDTSADLVGHAGFPEGNAGFGLLPDGVTGEILILPGVGHVAGVRHVVRPAAVLNVARVSGSGLATVWRIEAGPVLEDGDVVSATADGASGFVTVNGVAVDAQDGTRTFRTAPAIDPAQTRLFRPTMFTRQPYGRGEALPSAAGNYLAILKSTEISVSAVDDSEIREAAFDGPDTAVRDRTIWQVALVSEGDLLGLGYAASDLTCPALASGLDPVTGATDAGELLARAELSDLSAGPCTLPPAAGYRSLDNLLYRVEIHTGGDENAATWKWSRENAIHRTRYRTIEAGKLLVDSVGQDEMTALKEGDWIEIKDQESINGQAPGFFALIDDVDGQRILLKEILDPQTLMPLIAASQPDVDKLPRAAFVTRWEGGRPTAVDAGVGSWVDLENGVQVSFEAGFFQSSDHWTIPARAVSGDVEWPRSPVTGEPVAKPAEGPRRDYAALGWLARDAGGLWTITEDCRPIFPVATKAKRFVYAGGDGQEATPDPLAPATRVPLPARLSVAVLRGHDPIAGETVRFEIIDGDGRLGNGQFSEVVETDASGIAAVAWSLDGATRLQRVMAQRLDAAEDPTHHAITFNATLSRAAETSYDSSGSVPLAGTRTVQEALDALAALQQIGCTTYIVRDDQDWVAVLEGLKPKENASICFARGVYQTSRTVRLKGLGHVRLSGAGPTTVQLIANRVEAALAFVDCESVTVHGLEIAAPDGNSVMPDEADTHRLGALDIGLCPEVTVTGCLLRCGGGTSPRRSCLSIRGWSDTLGAFRATRAVEVSGNRFVVGNLQEAVIVTDAIDVDIVDNRFAVRPRTTSAINFDDFLIDKGWLGRISRDLVTRPVKGTISKPGGDLREIAGSRWRMSFESPVSQRDWDELVAGSPPTEADVASKGAFERYASSLIERVSQSPRTMPAFDAQLNRIRTRFGPGAQRFDQPEVARALLISSEPSVQRFDSGADTLRKVVIEANGQVVSFDSPFSQADWNRIITANPKAAQVTNADELLGLSHAAAREVLVDPRLRRRLGSVNNWVDRLRINGVSLGMQAIVCAGRQLDNVRIRGNVIRDFHVGIRVAPSHRRKQGVRARSVLIDDNVLELLAENADAYAAYGMMIGNVDTARIRGNDLRLSDKPNFRRYYRQGIRIWGVIGHQVLVAENRIEMATMGIRLNSVDNFGDHDRHHWVFRENLVRGPTGTLGHHVTPSWTLIDHHNLVRDL
ncbi:MAG: DUF6519 domain-containing protein [Pseudomonadota bacterium]